MRRLNSRELEDLVRWFTYHMSQDTRQQLMGDMPVHYALLYPTVDRDALGRMVQQRITVVSAQSDPVPNLSSI